MNKQQSILIFISLLFLSCGSGTFENDPKTWGKVFNEDIPKEVEIINSKFWKSTHWSYEYELFMKFKSNNRFVKNYFIDNFNLTKSQFSVSLNMSEVPNWFPIKDLNNYDIWINKTNYMKLYIDKKSNLFYIHCLQL